MFKTKYVILNKQQLLKTMYLQSVIYLYSNVDVPIQFHKDEDDKYKIPMRTSFQGEHNGMILHSH